MSSTEGHNSNSSQGNNNIPDDEILLKGCLYRFFKPLIIIIALLLFAFFMADNYNLGSKAFDKGYWESAVFFLEKVKPESEQYRETQEMLQIAREKLKQQQENK